MSEISTDAHVEPSRLTRRQFLNKAKDATVAGVAIAAGLAANAPDTKATPFVPFGVLDKGPAPSTTTEEYTYKENFKATKDEPVTVRISIQKNGLPAEITLFDSDEKLHFNQEQAKMLQERAIATGEPQILSVIPLPINPAFDYERKFGDTMYQPTKEHPKVTDLPPDAILTPEQFKAVGIDIIQGDEVQYFVRPPIFEEGGRFAKFDLKKHPLKMVIVDSLVVLEETMQAPRYDSVRHLAGGKKAAVVAYRQQKAKELIAELYEYRQQLHQVRTDQSDLNEDAKKYALHQLPFAILNAKLQYHEWMTFMSHTEAAMRMVSSQIGKGEAGGLYVPPRPETNGKAVIFVAVGPMRLEKDKVTVYFDEQGKCEIQHIPANTRFIDGKAGLFTSAYPTLSQGHPNPADFPLNPEGSPDNPDSYRYLPGSRGQTVGHELAHHEQYIENPDNPDYNEYDADTRSAIGMQKRWDEWEASKFTTESFDMGFVTKEGIVMT